MDLTAENLDFWGDVNDFKQSMDPTLMQKRGREIYDTYFSSIATKELNVSGNVLKKITESFNKSDINSTMYDGAQREAFQLMETDSFKRFRKDNLSLRLEKRLVRKNFFASTPVATTPSTPQIAHSRLSSTAKLYI